MQKRHIIRDFNRSASSYDSVAMLQREVADRLFERMDYIKLAPKKVLDLGCGTGYCLAKLERRYPAADIIGVDIASQMLSQAKRANPKLICADAEQLPFENNSIDLVFSNLMLHWCPDMGMAIAEIRRVLKQDGLLMFSTLGVDTLYEMRQSWAEVDQYSHVNDFSDMHDVGDLLMASRLKDPVMDREHIIMHYADLDSLCMDLKKLGASNKNQTRMNGLMGKNRLLAFRKAYQQFKTNDNKYPATYEVIYGHAWGTSDEFYVSIDDIPIRVK